MNNLVLEMQKVVDRGRENNLSNILIRNQLKEYLHYFVLDFIYNSQFKELIFYGGSCLRIIYDLPRMSEDLDFEADESLDFKKIAQGLESHFRKNLKLKEKFSVNKEKNINRIFLNIPIMHDLGLSAHKDEALRVKVEIRPVAELYLKKLRPVFTPVSKYGNSFMLKHYDLPTLFASKLAAILDRPQKGFMVGEHEDNVNYKGRDFFDLLWYMEKGVLPNEEMLKVNKEEGSIGDVFDKIGLFISRTDLTKGLKKDLEPLFASQNFVNNFTATYRNAFQNLRDRYVPKEVRELDTIEVWIDFDSKKHKIRFNYLCKNREEVTFLFVLSKHFFVFAEGDINIQLKPEYDNKIDFRVSVSDKGRECIKKYIALFLLKINDYLKRHQNEVYFDEWESKFIRMTDDNFNSEKEIVFSSGQELASNKKITIEELSL